MKLNQLNPVARRHYNNIRKYKTMYPNSAPRLLKMDLLDDVSTAFGVRESINLAEYGYLVSAIERLVK